MIAPRPTLLFLVTEDWYFVSHRLELARAAIANGWRVVVATRVETDAEAIKGIGCELRPLRWRRAGNTPLDHLRAFVEITALLRSERPHVVHLVALKPVVFGGIAARLQQVPGRVNAVAGLGFAFSSPTLRARAVRAVLVPLLRLALGGVGQITVVQNRADQEALIRAGVVSRDRVRLIKGAGVDPDRYVGPRSSQLPPVIVLVSRMLWDKGIGRFVAAAQALRSRGVPGRFVLVGDPDPDNPGSIPRAQLEAWSRQGIVEWWGHQDDIPRVLAGSAVFCLPTEYGEGIPRSLLEAAAAGLAIVATAQPGCVEVIQDEVSGLLVPPGDVRALSDALERVIVDTSLRVKLGDAARETIREGFSLDHVIQETLAAYDELRSGKGTPPR